MKIQWLGHSCFKLEESTGTTIVTDPYDLRTLESEMQKISADAVTISHNHHDHNAVENISNNPLIIKEVGSWEIKGVDIVSLLSNHDERNGKKRGSNLIFKYRMDGVDICHMGDVGEECTVKLSEAIGTVNILMIPVGGNVTIDAEQAKEYVDLLMPDIVIPMHFKTSSSKSNIEKLNEFLNLFDEEQIMNVEGESIEFDRSQFEGDFTRVVVFDDSNF
ncbi:MAG: MBL fold metallo-hydrolase [Clostridia bacterium]